jgi:hypothetical protein
MSHHEIAIKEYVNVVHELHKLTAEKIDYFVNLPSLKCESRSDIRDCDDVLMKVYKLQGHMKFNMLRFYSDYFKDLDVFVGEYCTRNRIPYPELSFDMAVFNHDVISTIQRLDSTIDTHPVMDGFDDSAVVNHIKLMFESIDILMSLEYKLCSVPNYDKLDVLKNSPFKFLRSNQLLYRVKNILSSYPQSGNYNVLKTSFLPALDKLTEGQDTYW